MSVSLRYKETEPNEANKPEREQEQTKFAKPDEQSMVQLENISQKTSNLKLTKIICNGSPQSNCKPANHTILATKLLSKNKMVETLSVIRRL